MVTLDKAGQAFKIATVEVGGPAERGGLRAGDVILALGGKTPGDRGDPILALERQIELAESRKDAALEATVLRDGKRMTVTVEVEFLGAHAATCPLQCRKCATVRDRAVRFLADTQNAQGGWETPLGGNNGRIVVATLAGLALHGARKHPEAVRRAVEYVVRTLDAPDPLERLRSEQGANWSQVNWPLAYAPLLLTAMPQEGGAMDALKAIAHKLIDNQEASGGYAHGPGGPNALDYVELEIVSNYALASLGLLRDRGLAVDAAGVDRGLAYIQACMAGDGGVAYSTRPGQAGHGDPGRTAGAFFALDRNGLGNSKAARKMLRYFERGMDTLPAGHVSPMMHLLAGAMAARASGQKGLLRDFWKCYRPYLMASRRHAGAFAARPTRETRLLRSNIDRTLGPAWTTATLALVLDLALDENACPHLFRAPSPRSKS
ncbi:MAG: PDZ domain-containing protein [Planctomycetes bacterium]|nr:PDZ domain-containing protein [Planctomycetota bacterium]